MMMVYSLEVRVFFLDSRVIDVVMAVDLKYKIIEGEEKLEKYVLCVLFDGEIFDFVFWCIKVM